MQNHIHEDCDHVHADQCSEEGRHNSNGASQVVYYYATAIFESRGGWRVGQSHEEETGTEERDVECHRSLLGVHHKEREYLVEDRGWFGVTGAE